MSGKGGKGKRVLPGNLKEAGELIEGLTTWAQERAFYKLDEPEDREACVAAMPLQDCVNLAIFFIRTTIDAQNLSVGVRGVGGPIDVAVITASEGIQFIQRKQIVGEGG